MMNKDKENKEKNNQQGKSKDISNNLEQDVVGKSKNREQTPQNRTDNREDREMKK